MDTRMRPSGFIPAVDTRLREPNERFKGPPVSMVCWSHETRTCMEDVVVDISMIPNARDGDVAEMRTLEARKPKKLYFIVKKLSEDTARLIPNVQISVLTGNLLSLLDIPPRSKVEVKLRDKNDVEADLVEIHFKDTYLTRADMWRISKTFIGKCFFTSQRLTYCDSVRCSINQIYRRGKKVFSAYIGPSTKFVYRSESARTIYFIQMSSEMWHFEENGEVMFHKLVNSFLPEVFRRWREQGAHHVVTIVLFTSVDVSSTRNSNVASNLGHGEREKNTRDYFRVVVDQVHINQWSDIMATLRYEFSKFAKEVILQPSGEIEGTILPAVKGNLMEAISLAMTMISSKFLDRDLRQTNSQVIIVTPGSGIYDVDYELFYQTSMKLLSIEISIDLVCLSRPPLHVTPLFRFKRDKAVVNCVPSWLDISFWKSTERHAKQWIPRCKIYEIQMMGVMENELSAISIDYLPKVANGKSLERLMNDYDENIYTNEQKPLVETANENELEPYLLKPRASSSELYNKSRSISNSIPASAIISSPALAIGSDGVEARTSTSAQILSNTIRPKPKPKVSALSSLLSLGMRRETSSSSTAPTPTPSTANSPKLWPMDSSSSLLRSEFLNDDNSSHKKLSHVTSFSSLKSNETEIAGTVGANTLGNKTPSTVKSIASTSSQSGDDNSSKTLDDATASSIQKSLKRVRSAAAIPKRTSTKQPLSSSPSSVTNASGDLADNNYVWVTVKNPSNLVPDSVQNISNYGRWKNVFPKHVKRRAVKWRSLKSPASLPLATEIFPSVEEFERNYTFQIYDVTLDVEREEHMTPGNLLEEMVAMRLMMGFQIVVGDRVSQVEAQRRPGGNPALIVQAIPEDYHDIRIYMTRSNQIHRLACDHYGTINVQLYRKSAPEISNFSRTYHPMVQTKYEIGYQPAVGNFFDPSVRNINWNLLDQQLAGFDDMVEGGNNKLFRIRFVLIPAEVPTNHPLLGEDELNTEEIRLEGLKKIIGQLHKGSYMPSDENRRKRNGKEIKPPEIKFYTGELGEYLVSLLDTYKNYYEGFANSRKKMFVNETMSRSDMTLNQLATELQSDRGIKLVSRRWHWKTYSNCFVGQEFVAWLLDNFTDIDASEDAVEFGNELMEQGLFHHVDNRHTFLDGHYFYQLSEEYLSVEKKEEREQKMHQSWFGKKFSENHRSSNPSSEMGSLHKRKGSAGLGSETSSTAGGAAGAVAKFDAHDQPGFTRLPKILISRAVKYDIDPGKRAPRHEFLTVHVDRVHNPENAFHMRMEWINATPKLIDEAVVNLSRTGERYGLKLVQVPIDEISSLPTGNPFCSFIRTEMNPEVVSQVFSAKDLSTSTSSLPAAGPNPLDEDPLCYHKHLLTRFGFVLDTVSSSSLMKEREVDILYSWGRPFYNFQQYIHQSGIVLAQIVENNGFILMANTLHISRQAVGPDLGSHPQQQQQQPEPASVADAEKIMFGFKSVCEDKDELFKVIEDAKQDWIQNNKYGMEEGVESGF